MQSGALDALGRRVREADPDSRAEAKRAVSAKRGEARVRATEGGPQGLAR